MAFGWDVEDDDEDDVENGDESHPFGEDEDNEDENPGQVDEQQKQQSDKEKKDDDDDDVVDGDNEDKEKDKNKKPPYHPDVMSAKAKENNMPPKVTPLVCPACKKKSLYLDPWPKLGIRAAVTVAKAIIGVFDAERDLNLPRYRCMNSECKAFWVKTKKYFVLHPTGALDEKKSWFTIER